jgi:hypothetical protein
LELRVGAVVSNSVGVHTVRLEQLRSLVTVGVAVSHSLLEQPELTALHAVPSTALLNDELSTQSAQVRSVVVEPSATWPLPLLHRVHSVHENESFCGAM